MSSDSASSSLAPSRAMPGWLQTAWSWVRPYPSEWVMLAWAAYVGIWILVRGTPADYYSLPRVDFLLVLLSVINARLILGYFRTPWSNPETPLAELFPATVLLAIIPSAGVFFEILGRLPEQIPTNFGDGGVGATYLFLGLDLFEELAASLTPIALWCELGRQLKLHGRLRPGAFIVGDGRVALEYLRQLIAPVLIIFCYALVGNVLRDPIFADKDNLMQTIDRMLCFGHDPSQELQAIITTPLSEWMALCYSAYAVVIPVSFAAIIAVADRRALTELSFTICFGFACGYTLYMLVPVQGPMYTEHFRVPLDYFYFGWVKETFIDHFRVNRDCFPSLHTAITLLCLRQLYRHARKVFWVALPIGATVPFACVYLRYHYLTDMVAGVFYALFVAWFTNRVMERWSPSLPLSLTTSATTASATTPASPAGS